ncbi:hypothetical protein HPP92_026655 [Vanilla planifolia]|uniref:Uncharacterized protein n=1 Tax=Vanilla planifolia TaxID=51239 RepID=A0A835PDI4_VANPL|nr:hypothetical protein HPP92_026655 [Vanilla planifolia]
MVLQTPPEQWQSPIGRQRKPRNLVVAPCQWRDVRTLRFEPCRQFVCRPVGLSGGRAATAGGVVFEVRESSYPKLAALQGLELDLEAAGDGGRGWETEP